MSSRHGMRRPRERSRSRDRSLERRHEHREHRSVSHRACSKDKQDHSKSKHRSPSREGKRKEKKKKSKKKKKHSSSSSSSDSEEEELKLLQRLEAERLRVKEEKRKQKDELKAKETPEEKRARRLHEKQEKERRRRERMGWDGEYQGYTNQDNPFGDSALTNTFVWGKKLAREGVTQVSREELDRQNRRKQLENKIELEKVKQRRLEREAEKAEREAEAAAAARAREAAQFDSWARQEDAFHLQQARLRSQIRIRDGRAKPIDLLAWYVSAERVADALEMHEPYTYLNGLQAQDLEDLLEDIKVYMELESKEHESYWQDVHTIVADELHRLRREETCRDPVHRSVAADVTQIFKGKSGAQLATLQQQIEGKLRGGAGGAAGGTGGAGGAAGAAVDVGYWESLLSQLKAHMARARLRERHQQNLRRKLQLLKEEQGVAGGEGGGGGGGGDKDMPAPSTSQTQEDETTAETGAEAETEEGAEAEGGTAEEEEEAEAEEACVAAYLAGRYSPAPLGARALEPGTLLTAAAEDEQRLLFLRAALQQRSAPPPAPGPAPASLAALEKVARAGMGADEAAFSVESALAAAPVAWADKYRPRKPRYFNRVHTGFEWNKYNQTHYDMDNPPPKVVQGYKFNIFYPDLVDKQATPHFSLKPCPENAEFAVLRFHAGPPYEDIAFKIVSREWEYSYKRGFRCHFHNNIFQLWFHFKRYRYRR